MSHANKDNFTSFSLICMPLFLSLDLIHWTSSTVLKRRAWNGHPCPILDFTEEMFTVLSTLFPGFLRFPLFD